MNFRAINYTLFIRLIFLLILAIIMGMMIIKGDVVWIMLITILIIISLLELQYKFNSVNRKLTYFFDAVRNEDSTLHFPEKIQDDATRQLHSSLNRLNSLISDIKIRNEHNERFFRELLKYSSTGIIAVDEEGYIDLINQSALRFLNMPQLAHMNLLKQKNEKVYEELVKLEPGQTNAIKVVHNEELQQISVKASQLLFGEKKFKIYSLYDIRAELEENEVQSWQKLIRVLTHEIMNSIAPITSLSKTLQRLLHFKNDETGCSEFNQQVTQAKEGLTVIEETGKGLMHFIDNYRRLTKIPKPVFKSVNIRDWLSRVEILMKERLEESNIKLTVQYKTQQQEFIADEKLLSQVFINILNNAIDASVESEKRKINMVVGYDDNGKLQFSIIDYGTGIPPEELDKVFIPFYTTKENGSGVGLSLSRQIVRLHKGSISVSSQLNKQTTFYLRF